MLLCLVCLFDLACFFLSSFSSLIKTCRCTDYGIYNVHVDVQTMVFIMYMYMYTCMDCGIYCTCSTLHHGVFVALSEVVYTILMVHEKSMFL